jgi:hypothetical protein
MGFDNLKVDHVWNVGGVINIGSFNLVHMDVMHCDFFFDKNMLKIVTSARIV